MAKIRTKPYLTAVLLIGLCGVIYCLSDPMWPRDIHTLPTISLPELPAEARDTLRHIKQGGPFPYAKDGTIFHNREKRLPIRSRNYYREYTVKTPGVRGRGARRIVAGSMGEFYFTPDHYRSFRLVTE
ncbi:MAG: ribonuclease domain-containing protein [Desulfomonilaceae bacterium]|nr:ribonuclease domain-containing protein [Desulfomonilaceae bacterium]